MNRIFIHLSESIYGYLHHQTKKSEEQKCVYIGFMDSSTPGILEGNYMCQVLPVVTFREGRLKIRDLHENRVIKLGHCQMVPKLGFG